MNFHRNHSAWFSTRIKGRSGIMKIPRMDLDFSTYGAVMWATLHGWQYCASKEHREALLLGIEP